MNILLNSLAGIPIGILDLEAQGQMPMLGRAHIDPQRDATMFGKLDRIPRQVQST